MYKCTGAKGDVAAASRKVFFIKGLTFYGRLSPYSEKKHVIESL